MCEYVYDTRVCYNDVGIVSPVVELDFWLQ